MTTISILDLSVIYCQQGNVNNAFGVSQINEDNQTISMLCYVMFFIEGI